MRTGLFFRRHDDHEGQGGSHEGPHRLRAVRGVGRRRGLQQRQAHLAAGHREVHLGQNLGVQQGAVQVAARVIDFVALTQGVEVVSLSRVHRPGQLERVQHAAHRGHALCLALELRELVVEEGYVECRVVDDELGVLDEFDELGGDLGKLRFAFEVGALDAVDGHRALVDSALGIHVMVKRAPRHTAVHDLNAADLDDAVIELGFEAGGFGVEDDLAHGARFYRIQGCCDRAPVAPFRPEGPSVANRLRAEPPVPGSVTRAMPVPASYRSPHWPGDQRAHCRDSRNGPSPSAIRSRVRQRAGRAAPTGPGS